MPHGASVEAVEDLADRLLASLGVVALGVPAARAPVEKQARPGAVRSFRPHTTEEMLATERAVLATAMALRGVGVAVVESAHLAGALAGQRLSDEQQALVARLVSSGDGVEVVVGKAGTGKTSALAVATDACAPPGCRSSGRRSRRERHSASAKRPASRR